MCVRRLLSTDFACTSMMLTQRGPRSVLLQLLIDGCCSFMLVACPVRPSSLAGAERPSTRLHESPVLRPNILAFHVWIRVRVLSGFGIAPLRRKAGAPREAHLGLSSRLEVPRGAAQPCVWQTWQPSRSCRAFAACLPGTTQSRCLAQKRHALLPWKNAKRVEGSAVKSAERGHHRLAQGLASTSPSPEAEYCAGTASIAATPCVTKHRSI